jgi:hypothetical protein
VTTLDSGATTDVINGISFISQDDWIIGGKTSGNRVTLSKGDTANVTATSKGVFIGQCAGSNNNTLLVQGTVLANTVTVGVTGATGNKLEIASDWITTAGTVTATGGIIASAGGMLLLSGSATVTDRLGNSTPVTLTSGGRFSTGGLSEESFTHGSMEGFGKLTLGGGAALDFATGANGSRLLAASGAVTGAGTLSILDWSGTAGTDSGAMGNDRLLFSVDPDFTVAELAQFQFYDDNNLAIGFGATEISFNGFVEIVPIPEPAPLASLALFFGVILGRKRWRTECRRKLGCRS